MRGFGDLNIACHLIWQEDVIPNVLYLEEMQPAVM